MSNIQIAFEAEMLLRILLASICGLAVGYERKNRRKDAGIRTHIMVCLGAALIMIVSKYGFEDILGKSGIALDPSRIAAQIVTGVGFLGAGIIFVRNQMVNGLTTAAGIWVIAGVGMAIGSGLYIIGIASTLFIIILQILLHLPIAKLRESTSIPLHVILKDETKGYEFLDEIQKQDLFECSSFKIRKGEHGEIDIKMQLQTYALKADIQTWIMGYLTHVDLLAIDFEL